MAGRGGLVGNLRLGAVDPHELGRERFALRGQEHGFEGPVFARREGADLALPIHNEPDGHGLDAAGRQTGADLAPEERAEGVADQAIHDPPRLLGIDEMQVDRSRIGEGLPDGRLRDLAEGDPARPVCREIDGLGDMPRNRLAFTVKVRGEVDEIRLLGGLGDLRDLLAAVRDDLVARREIVLDVHAELVLAELFGQIPDVPIGSQNSVAGPEVALDRLCLGRRFHDHQVVTHRGGV